MINSTLAKDEERLAQKLLQIIVDNNKMFRNRTRLKTATLSRAIPDVLTPKSSRFEDFDVNEIARQLCLYEQSIYNNIHPQELLDLSWSSPQKYKKAPNIMVLIDFFNSLSGWVAHTILEKEKFEDRVKVAKRFVRLACALRKCNNFNGAQEVAAGLNESSVYRLSKTWLKVEGDKKLWAEFEELKRELSPDKSWKLYRANLKRISPPCIPYLGVYLTDLTFIEDGNPNYLVTTEQHTDIINFDKCRKQAVVIANVVLYQQDLYNFTQVPVIYSYFSLGLTYEHDKNVLHQRSRSIEPPEVVKEARRKMEKRKVDQKSVKKK
eukprot:TRINITY_DN1617_c0_g1_i1.p1 TRINITY_DN1617_c0_g1~~TRINITY_DN1617_c0_g1_i1.p1  ORF type:complete len:322 (-),score=70.01 TRINITY_DN1617_c0_g1_i1:8-973(-)